MGLAHGTLSCSPWGVCMEGGGGYRYQPGVGPEGRSLLLSIHILAMCKPDHPGKTNGSPTNRKKKTTCLMYGMSGSRTHNGVGSLITWTATTEAGWVGEWSTT